MLIRTFSCETKRRYFVTSSTCTSINDLDKLQPFIIWRRTAKLENLPWCPDLLGLKCARLT